MAEKKILTLGVTDTATAFGLEVVFSGAVPVQYKDRPPAGSIILDFASDGKDERAVWMESDWGEPHEVFGYGYRVLNGPELSPRQIQIEITDREGPRS